MKKTRNRKEKDITGLKFQRLTGVKTINKKYWLFRCDCGNEKVIRKDGVVEGIVKSCGCTRNKHLLYKHPLYKRWIKIKQRCYNLNDPSYKYYGKRGVVMCDKWKNDFMLFYDWSLENGWSNNLTIDRIDNKGGYSPDNCQYISRSENSMKDVPKKLNKIAVKVIQYCLAKGFSQRRLAKAHGVNQITIWRIANNNLPVYLR